MARHGSRVARTGHSFRRLRPAGLNPMQAAVVALCAVVLSWSGSPKPRREALPIRASPEGGSQALAGLVDQHVVC